MSLENPIATLKYYRELDSINKYHFTYEITNKINGFFYLGVHSTNNLDDGYMGSSNALREDIKRTGLNNFSKVILKMFNKRVLAVEHESRIIPLWLVKKEYCYNLQHISPFLPPLRPKPRRAYT